MRVFDEFPDKVKCPICGSNKKGKFVLIIKDGTQDGNIAEAVPVHLDCIQLRMTEEKDGEFILYQLIKVIKND